MSTSILPIPRSPVTVRPATAADLPFMDSLQKLHSKQVGWMPTAQFEEKIKLGQVIVAEDDAGTAVGYCIGADQYFKRDDVGIIYQMNVVPTHQRGLIGATLLRAQFERSAYGCRLYCCWCAQDIAANRFWEAMGFVPLAYRAGGAGRGKDGGARVHIFWQRRIRAGDVTTPWWYPSKTTGGSIREDRIVFPIPPGTHWSDAKPIILPGESSEFRVQSSGSRALPTPRAKKAKPVPKRNPVCRNGMWFDVPKQGEPIATEKPKREKKPKPTHDPRLVSAARELRDRWLERVNADPAALPSGGKYDVSREMGDVTPPPTVALPLARPAALPAPMAPAA